MSEITTIGLDLAKNIFQVHGVDETGMVVVVKRLRRSQVIGFFAGLPPCLIGMEACATAHHWARELSGLGHEVRLMPPQYVKAYVKRNKNDAADAAGDLRGGQASVDAFRASENNRAAVGVADAPCPRSACPPAHDAGQRTAWALGRVRSYRGTRPAQGGRADCNCHGRQGRAHTGYGSSGAKDDYRPDRGVTDADRCA